MKNSRSYANRNWEEKNHIYLRTVTIRDDEISKEKWKKMKDFLYAKNSSISLLIVEFLKDYIKNNNI